MSMRSRLAALLLAAGCGPSGGIDEACTRDDIVTSGALVVGPEREECSPCDPEASHVLITLETTCEAGVEWVGSPRLIDQITAVNLATQERFVYEDLFGQPAEGPWRVDPGEPLVWPGPRTDQIVTEPGDYSFRVELLYDLMAAEFEESVE
jgi:hypothetical protein